LVEPGGTEAVGAFSSWILIKDQLAIAPASPRLLDI
jgi:hypothetical protein